jgi:hypothetical protein
VSEDADSLRRYAQLGVDRLVVQLGSQKPEAVDERLGELDALVRRAS